MSTHFLKLYRTILDVSVSSNLSDTLRSGNEHLIKLTRQSLDYMLEATSRMFKQSAKNYEMLLALEIPHRVELSMEYQVSTFFGMKFTAIDQRAEGRERNRSKVR